MFRHLTYFQSMYKKLLCDCSLVYLVLLALLAFRCQMEARTLVWRPTELVWTTSTTTYRCMVRKLYPWFFGFEQVLNLYILKKALECLCLAASSSSLMLSLMLFFNAPLLLNVQFPPVWMEQAVLMMWPWWGGAWLPWCASLMGPQLHPCCGWRRELLCPWIPTSPCWTTTAHCRSPKSR